MRARIGLSREVLAALGRLAAAQGLSLEVLAVEIIGDELPSALAAAAEQSFRGGRSADMATPPTGGGATDTITTASTVTGILLPGGPVTGAPGDGSS